jgi:hypothetical protein
MNRLAWWRPKNETSARVQPASAAASSMASGASRSAMYSTATPSMNRSSSLRTLPSSACRGTDVAALRGSRAPPAGTTSERAPEPSVRTANAWGSSPATTRVALPPSPNSMRSARSAGLTRRVVVSPAQTRTARHRPAWIIRSAWSRP